MFDDSPNTDLVLEYFNDKYGQVVAPVGLFKTLAVVSSKLKWPRLSVNHIAPTRQLKSRTSNDVIRFFPEKDCIVAGSDFTIHRLYDMTRGDVDGKCLFVNDGTLLITSKSRRTKERLFNGIAELLSDEVYKYGDFRSAFEIRGKCTAVMNMTAEAFNRYEDKLLSATFLERFLTAFYFLTKKEITGYAETADKYVEEIGEELTDITQPKLGNYQEYKKTLIEYGKDFSALSLRSTLGCIDIVKALVFANVSLNRRDNICDEDLEVLRIAREYVVNPFKPQQSRIMKYVNQGRSTRDICLLLNMDYKAGKVAVWRVRKKAKERGIVTW